MRCVYCHDSAPTVRCGCGAAYHDDCSVGPCATIGCSVLRTMTRAGWLPRLLEWNRRRKARRAAYLAQRPIYSPPLEPYCAPRPSMVSRILRIMQP